MTRGSAVVKRGGESIADCRGPRALRLPRQWDRSPSF